MKWDDLTLVPNSGFSLANYSIYVILWRNKSVFLSTDKIHLLALSKGPKLTPLMAIIFSINHLCYEGLYRRLITPFQSR